VDRTRRELLRTAVDYRFAGIVYCFMPDHFHALFEAMAAGSDFRKCVNMLKQRTAFAHKRAARAKLWQHVRAGLCDDARKYPFMGSTCYSVDELCEAVGQRAVTWRPRRP